MESLNQLPQKVIVIQADGQNEFESLPVETITSDSQLWKMLGLNAAQLTYFLEEAILENPFVDMEYPSDKRHTTGITLHEHDVVAGVDPQMPAAPHNLPMFLFEQIMMYRQTPIRDAMVRLIDYLDERGYLPYTYQELAAKLDLPDIVVLDAVTLIQQLEPAGVGAYDLQNCLMIQTEQDSHSPNVAYYLLEEYFPQLVDEDFEAIQVATGLSESDIATCVNYYHTLRPNPAELFDTSDVEHLVPDVTVDIQGDVMSVHYNQRYYPHIVFNQAYCDEMIATQDAEVIAYCKPHLEAYHRLARNLKVREQLILKVAQAITAVQYDYFAQKVTEKQPLLLKQLAQVTELPEPIVSMSVSNKNIAYGMYVTPLVEFITVATHEGRGGFTAEHVKKLIHDILHEGPATLSDAEIVAKLEQQKVMISELMVRNYREALGYAEEA